MTKFNRAQDSPIIKSRWVLAAGFYFLICGLSAIFWPSIWYELAGLGTMPFASDLVLAVLGIVMTSLGLGAFIASTNEEELLLLKMFLFANLGDAAVVIYFTMNGTLSEKNGLGFLLIDAFWSAALVMTYRKIKNSHK